MSGHLITHGRGGAGNMADSARSTRLEAKDLETPTLKTPVVTTGRGGTGNMARNKDPIETRALQDVEPVARRPSQGATHIGRGGTGNVFKPGSEEAEMARRAAALSDGAAIEDDSYAGNHRKSSEERRRQQQQQGQGQPQQEKSLAAKGKEWLLGKK